MPTPVRFRLLGAVGASRDGTEIELGAPRQRLVLAALLLASGNSATVAQLCEAVWGSCAPRTAGASLRNSVSRLRAALGDDAVFGVDGGYGLAVNDLDLHEARRLADAARDTTNLARRRELLNAACRLWTDEPLAGLGGAFADFQRSRLRDLRLTILENLFAVELRLGAASEVVERLAELCRDNPFREEPHRLLMLALHDCGRDAEALEVYDELRERLNESLGIDPCAAVARLSERILTPAAPMPPPPPAQLPADTGVFTGRERLASQVIAAMGERRKPVVALSGIGGVGKTTLAVHVAHRMRDRFGDGQLFADLRGVEPDLTAPGAVLARFLRAFGVAEAEIPEAADERAALFASIMDDKRVLLLLDNVHDADQIRPLIPATGNGAVLITSRSRLSERDDARHFGVDVLAPAEADTLFRRIVGSKRADADSTATREVVTACGFLPLAVRIAAHRALSRPQWTIAELAARLADQHRRLAELRAGDESVAAAFALSYSQLEDGLATAFRLLTTVELPAFTVTEAATVLRAPAAAAARTLTSLADLGLLDRPEPDRYRFHDLVRLFGSQRADTDEHHEALRRLVRHYLAHTVAAIATAHPEERSRLDKMTHTRLPDVDVADRPAAMDWLNDNVSAVLRVLRQAAREGSAHLGVAAELLYAITYWAWSGVNRQNFVDAASELADAAFARADLFAEARARLALFDCLALWSPHRALPEGLRAKELALKCDDQALHAEACMLLGAALLNTGGEHREEALAYQTQAIAYFGRTPELAGRAAAARAERALTLMAQGDHAAGLAESARAVEELRALDNDGALVRGLYQRGLALRGAGSLGDACAAFRASHKLSRRIRDRPIEMLSLYNLARCYADSAADNQAIVYAEQAVAASIAVADADKQARSLAILGRCLRRCGSTIRGRRCLSEAVDLLNRSDRPDAAELSRQLASELTSSTEDGRPHD
ncbi:MAG TPA: BTAD domain-containing putative transcriptional regulator [Stackebrandtia sp.]|jgi:DNA-binding SARP family transcriptional activator|uniref:AfsR/SARP family transcriptional regulator n=1 Tax=Stackebrandtia sp. TaxID=2023065 RepID=UPI002D5B5BC9|nr:BTAD domain-containing putative transcriptional regulator [Stackebrandtia sp.]HZE41105.1 BTAD domain-containing putative transcriptional regulator [Stackebrandtia sp.]